MAPDWTQEEKTLLNIKKIIARSWRMNRQQLQVYCRKLERNRDRILPGQTGSAFIEKLEWISGSGMDAGTKIWPLLIQDTDRLLNLIHGHQNLDRKAWLAALPKLEACQSRYFKTELGTAFILDLKVKTGLGVPEKKPEPDKTVPAGNVILTDCMADKKELETVAAWLMEDVRERGKKTCKIKRLPFHRQIKRAAVPVLACLSVCFMSVWLHGQFVRERGRWSLQQMKVSAPNEAEIFIENMKAVPDSISHAEKLSDVGQPVEKMQVQDRKQPETRPEKLPQYREMSEKYPQLYGWLQIPDTQIDLTVMRPESDRDFYLHHDFSGTESAEGALFADAESSLWPRDDNTVIYGHNMKNGHIFGTLKMYGDADFFQEHREICFDTLYETGVYEAVAVLRTRILNEDEPGFRYYRFFQYGNKKEFQECRDFVEENRLFETDSTLQYGDQILMLSTCEYSQENGRLVVVARKRNEKSADAG